MDYEDSIAQPLQPPQRRFLIKYKRRLIKYESRQSRLSKNLAHLNICIQHLQLRQGVRHEMDTSIPQFYLSCSYSDSLGKNIDLRNTSPMPLIKSPILYHILKSWRNAPPRTFGTLHYPYGRYYTTFRQPTSAVSPRKGCPRRRDFGRMWA